MYAQWLTRIAAMLAPPCKRPNGELTDKPNGTQRKPNGNSMSMLPMAKPTEANGKQKSDSAAVLYEMSDKGVFEMPMWLRPG